MSLLPWPPTTTLPMPLHWTPEQQQDLQEAMASYPATSGHCSALARRAFAIAHQADASTTRGVQLTPRGGARYLVARQGGGIYWYSHTLVETRDHDLDALTGPPGHDANTYLDHYFESVDLIEVRTDVDLTSIDPGLQQS